MRVCKRELAAVMLLGGALPAGAAGAAPAAAYPERPITLVVGYPVGGGADTLARIVGHHMAEAFGQKVIIENRPGAASNIAAQSVSRSAPDGYTLFLSARVNTLHRVLYSHLDFDFAQDFVSVGLVATMPNVIVASKSAPVSSVSDLVAMARAYPGTLTCGSSGFGSTGHLLCELFQQEAGVDIEHVPYKGSAAALTDLIGGRIDVLFDALPATIGHIKAESVRVLSAISRRRLEVAKNVPTMSESGFIDVEGDAWLGLAAPAGTPSDVVARLNDVLNSVLAIPALQQTFLERGYVVPEMPNTRDLVQRGIGKDAERWAALIRQRNLVWVQ